MDVDIISKDFEKFRKYPYFRAVVQNLISGIRLFDRFRKNFNLLSIMSGLDAVDISILRILQEDAALTNKQVAARVHLSPTPVFERIRRLREQGYIKGYVAVLDTEKLDCAFMAFCFLKMKQHSFENAQRLMDAVQTMDEVGE